MSSHEPTQRSTRKTKESKINAEMAFKNRSKKSSDAFYYWMVVGFFVVVCICCVIYVFSEWRESPTLVPAVDSKSIEKHNAKNALFKRGSNSLFTDMSLDDAKHLMQSELSEDYKEIFYCASKEDKTTLIPEKYDFRALHKECAGKVRNQGNCSAGYAIAVASMISDRICLITGKRVEVSAQQAITCNSQNEEGCIRGYADQAIRFYGDDQMIEEECIPYSYGKDTNCSQKCKKEVKQQITGLCGIDGQEGIKREIVVNGPVIARMPIFDDFLTYKSGIYTSKYHRYLYSGAQIVKVIGWGEENDVKYWLIENSWGEDWGEGGLARIEMLDAGDMDISRLVLAANVPGEKLHKKTPESEKETA